MYGDSSFFIDELKDPSASPEPLMHSVRGDELRKRVATKGLLKGQSLIEIDQGEKERSAEWRIENRDEVLKQFPTCAVDTPRTGEGLPKDGKLRLKEAAGRKLACQWCKVAAEDWNAIAKHYWTVSHFDIDGISKDHAKDRGGASRQVGKAESELKNKVAQILCVFCHRTKSHCTPLGTPGRAGRGY